MVEGGFAPGKHLILIFYAFVDIMVSLVCDQILCVLFIQNIMVDLLDLFYLNLKFFVILKVLQSRSRKIMWNTKKNSFWFKNISYRWNVFFYILISIFRTCKTIQCSFVKNEVKFVEFKSHFCDIHYLENHFWISLLTFLLHPADYFFWKVYVCNIYIPFWVKVFWKLRIPTTRNQNIRSFFLFKYWQNMIF